MACDAVGEEIKIKTAIAKSFKKTHTVVTCNIIPKIRNITPPVSLMEALCNLDQKSGSLIKPKLPVKSKNDPRRIKIQLHISTNIVITLFYCPRLFCPQFLYI
jgi:hypothetical protein